MSLLDRAIDAHNRIKQLPEAKGIVIRELDDITLYLQDQHARDMNTQNGLEYLNRELDVIADLKERGLSR